MRNTSGIEAMHAHRAAEAREKSLATITAVEDLIAANSALTVAAVARRAGVSREFIYSREELRNAIRLAQERLARRALLSPLERGGEEGLRAERATLLARVSRLSQQLVEKDDELIGLRSQRAESLGRELDALTGTASSAEMRAENERLNERVQALSRDLQTALRAMAGLEDDLRIARAAHSQSIQDLTQGVRQITVLNPRKPDEGHPLTSPTRTPLT